MDIILLIGGIVGFVCIFTNRVNPEHQKMVFVVSILAFLFAGMLIYSSRQAAAKEAERRYQEQVRKEELARQAKEKQEKEEAEFWQSIGALAGALLFL